MSKERKSKITRAEMPGQYASRKHNKGDGKMLATIKRIFKYLIATCDDCKHCDECAMNGFMCGFVGGTSPNYFEFKGC